FTKIPFAGSGPTTRPSSLARNTGRGAAMGRPGPRVRFFAAAIVSLTRSGVAGWLARKLIREGSPPASASSRSSVWSMDGTPAGPGGQLDADLIRLALLVAAVGRQHEPARELADTADDAPERGTDYPHD